MSDRQFYVIERKPCSWCMGGIRETDGPCTVCDAVGYREVRVPLSEALAEMVVAVHCRCVASSPALEAYVCSTCHGVCS